MKVLFLTYPRIGLRHGGLQVQIEKTAEELSKLGVEVVLYDPWESQIEDVDICHVFSIDGAMLWHVQRAAEQGKGVVVSPVFGCFTNKSWQVAMKVKLSQCLPGVLSDLVRARAMLSLGDRILALNEQEKRVLIMGFGLDAKRCRVVPNGINERFSAGDRRLAKEKFGVEDFVLNVGYIDPNKNQQTLIEAMAGLPYKLVIVGQARLGYEGYVQKCRALAGDNVIFTGQLDYEDPLLVSAYAAAKLFVLPSYSEVMPLTLYEAAGAGCKIIASRNIPLSEKIRQYVPTFNPNKPKELAALIDEQMRSGRDDKLRKIVNQMPSWADVGRQIKSIYEQVLLENKDRATG